MAKKRKWIKRAIRKPGSLRRTAREMGLIEGNESLSLRDLAILEAKGGSKTKKRARLARTLRKFK